MRIFFNLMICDGDYFHHMLWIYLIDTVLKSISGITKIFLIMSHGFVVFTVWAIKMINVDHYQKERRKVVTIVG